MNKTTIAVLAGITVAGFAVGAVSEIARGSAKSRRIDAEIEKQLQLDIRALKMANARITCARRHGNLRDATSYQIEQAFNDEVEFQKIAIRES